MARRRFPYRTFFRWFFFVLFAQNMVTGPLMWKAYWHNYFPQTVHDLNQNPNYARQPGLAEAATWHIEEKWTWVLGIGIVLFVLYLPLWWWARPARDPKVSSW